MNWLDLGWLKRESGWELHPWGPLSRGYQVSESQFVALRNRIRWIRGSLLLLVSVPFLLSGAWQNPFAWLSVAALAGFLEVLGIHTLCGSLERTAPLGWEKGMLYLAKWFGPKILLLCRNLTLGLLGLSLVLIFWNASSWQPYLLTAFFTGVLFLLNYLQQVQGGRLQ